MEFPDDETRPSVESVVAKTAELLVAKTISIPRILTFPKGDIKTGFEPFSLELDTLTFIEPSAELIVQHLRTNERERIGFECAGLRAKRLEDYIVFALIDQPDVDYFTQSDLLYDLSSQVVQHFREAQSRTDKDIEDIFILNQRPIARFVYEQMRVHRFEEATEYETVVSQGFVELKPSAYTARETDRVYKLEEPPPKQIRHQALCLWAL